MKSIIIVVIGFLSAFLPLAGYGQDLTSGLVAYYPFNGNANDVSGNGNHGTVNGATLAPDRFSNPNRAYGFDGVDDYIVIPDMPSLDITGALTLGAWMFLPDVSDIHTIVAKLDNTFTSTQQAYELVTVGNELRGTIYDNESGAGINDGALISQSALGALTTAWHHVALVYDGGVSASSSKLYIDGQRVDSQGSVTGNFVAIHNVASDVMIGAHIVISGQVGTFFNGLIDEVRIYDRALTDDEIEALFLEGAEVANAAVFATNSVWLKQNVDILSGHVFVNDVSPGPMLASQVELTVGDGVTTSSGYDLKANRVKVKQNAVVDSDVYYNTLTNNGTITGSLNTPVDLPLLQPQAFPPFNAATACGQGFPDITVNQNDSLALAPGNYGDVTVKKKGVVFFTATGDGLYTLCSLDAGINTRLLFGDVSEVRIEDKFDTDQNSYVGPGNEAGIEASDIVFYVAGINGNNGNLGATPKAAQVGLNNEVFANFYVPNGTLWLRQGTEATGAFWGKDVIVGISTQLSLGSFLGGEGSTPPARIRDKRVGNLAVASLETPKAFALDQNYPNPFNPVTTIAYSLPVSQHVTVTVFDALGREVARLVDGRKTPGRHEVVFDASALPSGVYLYRLQTDGYTETRMLLLAK